MSTYILKPLGRILKGFSGRNNFGRLLNSSATRSNSHLEALHGPNNQSAIENHSEQQKKQEKIASRNISGAPAPGKP